MAESYWRALLASIEEMRHLTGGDAFKAVAEPYNRPVDNVVNMHDTIIIGVTKEGGWDDPMPHDGLYKG